MAGVVDRRHIRTGRAAPEILQNPLHIVAALIESQGDIETDPFQEVGNGGRVTLRVLKMRNVLVIGVPNHQCNARVGGGQARTPDPQRYSHPGHRAK